MPRKVKVGPSKETILVLGGELATHLVTTDPCLQTKEKLFNEKKESLDETLKRTAADSRESSCWPQS